MADNHYDVIIIGTGAGGGTLAYRLAPSGKRVLLLERGGYVPREKENWDSHAVEVENRYHVKEAWLDRNGKEFHAGTTTTPAEARNPARALASKTVRTSFRRHGGGTGA